MRILAGVLDREAGSHIYHCAVAERLAARGHRVSVVCFTRGTELAGVDDVRELGPRTGSDVSVLWRVSPLIDRIRADRSLRACALAAPDVTIGGEHLLLGAHAGLFPGQPWIYLPHALLVEHEIRGYGLSWLQRRTALGVYTGLQRWALRHADRTVRFTRYGCRLLAQRYGARVSARFEVIPIAVEAQPPPAARGDGPPRLLLAGRLVPGKGVGVALAALARVAAFPWRLDVVGDGPERPALEALAGHLGIADRVTFRGHQHALGSWYRGADLLLMPSRSESLALVIPEAMSHGVPVLGLRPDGHGVFNPNEELIRDGVDGFLAQSDDAFAALLGQLLGDRDRLAAAGAEAWQRARREFTWERHLERLEALFEALIRERSGGRA